MGLLSATAVSAEDAGGPTLESPFVYRQLTEAVVRRTTAEQAVREYMVQAQARLRELQHEYQANVKQHGVGKAQEVFRPKYYNFTQKVIADTQYILYGVREPHARQAYLDAYGFAKWTERALKLVARYAPIVEVGNGAGHWQSKLVEHGADVVQEGNESGVAQHPERTLFLCYPAKSELAHQCLQCYKGQYLIYVGEGADGVNASPAFFADLAAHWRCTHIEKLDPFAECFEYLFVFERIAK